MTKLTSKTTAPAPPDMGTRLGAVLAGSRVFVDVEVPRTNLVGKLRLLSHDEEELVNLEVARWLAGLDVTERLLSVVGGLPVTSRRALLIVAIAVRDPVDPERPLGTLEEWGRFDDAVIGPLWRRYQDLAEQLDPWSGNEVDANTAAEIRVAIEKKDPTSLLAFGARTLATFLLTTAAPPAASETPR